MKNGRKLENLLDYNYVLTLRVANFFRPPIAEANVLTLYIFNYIYHVEKMRFCS